MGSLSKLARALKARTGVRGAPVVVPLAGFYGRSPAAEKRRAWMYAAIQGLGEPIVLPLAAHYGQEPDRERERNRFYALCAQEFGWDGWHAVREMKRSHLTARDDASHIPALEFLHQEGLLCEVDGDPRVGTMRWEAGTRVRDDIRGAEISGLKSQNLTGVPGGSGGGGRPVADYAIDCMKRVGRLRAALGTSLWPNLEAMLMRDERVWLIPPAEGETEAQRMERRVHELLRVGELRNALDWAALEYGMLSHDDYLLLRGPGS